MPPSRTNKRTMTTSLCLRPGLHRAFSVVLGSLTLHAGAATIEKTDAQTPLRPPPEPPKREMAAGPAYFVDARNGSDRNDGSKARPWLSIGRAVKTVAEGDTLYLRGGV